MLITLTLLACGSDAVEPTDTGELEPSPYIYEEGDDEVTPSLEPEEIADAITASMGSIFEVHAGPVLEAYSEAMAGEQEDCPDEYSDGTNTYWYDYCYADDGTYFSGYGFYYGYEDYEADGYLYNGAQAYTVSEIVTPDGYTFAGGGSASLLVATYDWEEGDESVPHTYFISQLEGTFSWDGPSAVSTWMDLGLEPTLSIQAYRVPEETSPYYFGNYVLLSGGLGGLETDAGTVIMDEVVMASAALGAQCVLEPSGTISVRDDEGLWYDVVYDNEFEEAMDEAACDGCGAIYFRGDYLGEACSDFDVLLDWEGDLW